MPKIYLSLFFLFCIKIAFAQTTIIGTVANERGQAMQGATVAVKSTNISTTTDRDGKFSLNVPEQNGELIFSAFGYVVQERMATKRSSLYIKLVLENDAPIEEVPVAYGKQEKKQITGSIVTEKGSQLVRSHALNLSASLAGRLPGLTVINPSGEPGNDGALLFVRGINTLADNSPLIVVDGIPNRFGGLDRLNPADIESITVLKDASAAMYGVANGVVLVTTRRGQIGKPTLTYSFNQGFSNPTVIPKLADAAQYTSMLNELNIYNSLPAAEWEAAQRAYQSTGVYNRPNGAILEAPYSPGDLARYRDNSDPWGHPNTDWFGATLKRNSPQVRHRIQLTGGTTNFQYLASLGYLNQDAYYRSSATGYQQYDLRINLDAAVNKHIDLSLDMLGRQEARNYSPRSASTVFRMLMRGKPQQPAYWPNGLPGPDIENGENPVVISTNQIGYDRDKRNYVQATGSLVVKVPGVEGLKMTVKAAIDNFSRDTKRWEIPWTLYYRGNGFESDGLTPKLTPAQRGPEDPRLTVGTAEQLNITPRLVISYDKTLGGHMFGLLAGTERYKAKRSFFTAYRRYFISTALDQLFAGGDKAKDNSGGSLETSRNGYFGKLGYGCKDKYFIELQGRYDGSDILPAEDRYRLFYGLMLGWIVSEEKFWEQALPTMTFLKIRGSAGILGSDQSAVDPSSNFNLSPISNASSPPIAYYLPSPTYNLGLEGRVLNDRISFEVDIFSNPHTKTLTYEPGPRLPEEKITEIANKGWEFSVFYRNRSTNLPVTFGINGGYARNKIIFQDEAPGAPDWQRSTGKPINTYFVYKYNGVFKDQAEINANPLNYSALVKQIRPGDMKYQDVNGDKKITPDDRVRLKTSNLPVFQGGITLDGRYRNFDLNILLQGSAGAKQFISTGESGTIGNYLLDIYQNRWSIDIPSSVHPRIANRNDQYYSNGNDYWLRSTDYIRLKNLELGYAVQTDLINKIGLNRFRLYVSGYNLLTFDRLKIYDPEASSALGYYYPQQKIVSFGLDITF
ncbi:SusC/RagA family TonB-linked outer membrane protein [Persicitalea sp.]|uniref:SusC/RagA family TonB-linked outer membrane protein n=1 Tax=Persicitalea sp. TaxID=3100273 RepID=UPI003593CDDE